MMMTMFSDLQLHLCNCVSDTPGDCAIKHFSLTWQSHLCGFLIIWFVKRLRSQM